MYHTLQTGSTGPILNTSLCLDALFRLDSGSRYIDTLTDGGRRGKTE